MEFDKVIKIIENRLEELKQKDVHINDNDSVNVIRMKDMQFGRIAGIEEILVSLIEAKNR